jgi:hypothetical protein
VTNARRILRLYLSIDNAIDDVRINRMKDAAEAGCELPIDAGSVPDSRTSARSHRLKCALCHSAAMAFVADFPR